MWSKLRAARPDIALSGDFITGFPGETDADFEDTLKLVRAARFAAGYSFKYSNRPGTPGSLMGRQVPDDVSSARLYALQALLQELSGDFNRACEGRELDVLFQKPGRQAGQLIGYSQYMQAIYVADPALQIGDRLPVTITGGYANSLAGEIVRREAA